MNEERAPALYLVMHEIHGTAHVIACDKHGAVIQAARLWKVPWTSIARQCEFERGAEVSFDMQDGG